MIRHERLTATSHPTHIFTTLAPKMCHGSPHRDPSPYPVHLCLGSHPYLHRDPSPYPVHFCLGSHPYFFVDVPGLYTTGCLEA